MRVTPTLALWLAAIAVSVAAAVYLWLAISSRRQPALQVWHTARLDAEFHARDAAASSSLADYLDQSAASSRSWTASRRRRSAFPSAIPVVDATIRDLPGQLEPQLRDTAAEIRGVALLLHAHRLAVQPAPHREILCESGFYVLGLRLPGHGTVPASLAEVTRRDWLAAVRIGAKHATAQAGPDAPFWIVGYSNGAALALDHALATLADPSLGRPTQLVLLSPAVGVSPFAAIGRWHRPLSMLPFFEKFRWHTIYPEHDPFKYNSFPKSAAFETHRLIVELRRELDRIADAGRIDELPAVLAFQSVADATVRTAAVLDSLFLKLAGTNSELVAFDINRVSYMQDYFAGDPGELLARLCVPAGPPFRLTLVTNADRDSQEVIARRWSPGSSRPVDEPLGLSWPLGVFRCRTCRCPSRPTTPSTAPEPEGSPTGACRSGAWSRAASGTCWRFPSISSPACATTPSSRTSSADSSKLPSASWPSAISSVGTDDYRRELPRSWR
jgi:esterase/lipase